MKTNVRSTLFKAAARVGLGLALSFSGLAFGQVVEPNPVPGSLKNIPIPQASDITTYIKDNAAAIRLGKALFWDMQVGSDNQACASCHFHAGADDRSNGQLDPGLRSVTPDDTYQLGGPNFQLQPSHFPFHKLQDPENRHSTVLADTNDVVSSLGNFYTQFSHINLGQARDAGTALPDPDFRVKGVNVRRVPPRNTPSVINAVFNTYNFWDGRANYYFNGNNPFGGLDMNSGIFVDVGGTLHKQIIRIEKSSLASQAVGPVLSDMEMSFSGRTWPDVGKKMLSVVPLALQIVHPNDSVLGPLSKATKPGQKLKGPGLKTDYASMIRAAFWDQYWSSNNTIVTFVDGQPVFSPRPGGTLLLTEYTQMEANFSFFFGLAIQAYESTLVSDDSPWDRHAENPAAFPLTTKQALGLGVFLSAGKSPFERERGACVNCHTGSEFTNASFSVRGDPTNRIEIMLMGDGGAAFYDGGSYNTGSRGPGEDIGREGNSPFVNPLTGQPFPLSLSKLGLLARSGLIPPAVAPYIAPLPFGVPFPDPSRTATNAAFKTPSLRNVELTGPYFHNGGQATLRQVVDFYDRGGDFAEDNLQNLHFDIVDLFLTDTEKDDLVEFMLALTDERVRQEKGPFDHPQLFLPNGSRMQGGTIVGDFNLIRPGGYRDTELVRELPAVGVGGLPAEGLPPIQTFLGLDPRLATTGP